MKSCLNYYKICQKVMSFYEQLMSRNSICSNCWHSGRAWGSIWDWLFRKIFVFGELDDQSRSKTFTLSRFDVLRVATGSYTLEKKRIASRKLFRQVPGLQDVNNGPKRIKTAKNPRKSDFAVFFCSIFPTGSAAWGASQGIFEICPHYLTPGHLHLQLP